MEAQPVTAYDDILYHAEQGVATITINRPAKLNAFRDQTADELLDAFAKADADSDIRAAIVTGAGRAFGAGYDLAQITPDAVPALDDVLERHFNPLIRFMRNSRLPIVSAVNGACAGAAIGLALAGDIVLAARSSYFYEPFVNIALIPDAGNTLFLPRIVGRGRALPMMLLGDRIGAEKALAWGLVWEVHEDDALMQAAAAIAAKLSGLDPAAVAATKRLVTSASDFSIDEQLGLERDLQGIAGRSDAVQKEITAFFARRR
jgi:2-(1,2-epoxy-1,2-dihydrophenyl)acetyl-CoA isomerase